METYTDWLPPAHTPHMPQPGVGSDPKMKVRTLEWESNLRPFSEWGDALTIDKHWLSQHNLFLIKTLS